MVISNVVAEGGVRSGGHMAGRRRGRYLASIVRHPLHSDMRRAITSDDAPGAPSPTVAAVRKTIQTTLVSLRV